MSGDLLQTKLYVPHLRPFLVPRPHLIQHLNQGLHQLCKLILISAPAGFGKTTLVSEWIHQKDESRKQKDGSGEVSLHPSRVAWLSLDEGDHDLTRFLTYFVAALNRLQGVEKPLGEGAMTMLQSPQPPPTEVILTALINDIAALSDSIVLVLDDYHVIESPPVDEAVTFFLEHLPPQLNLVVITRVDPALPLARLRGRRQLLELRAADLRFTSAETAEFLNQVMGLNLSAADIAALEERTEGWISGLQLAAISMQGRNDAASRIKSFTGSHRFVLDYLIEEVLAQQPEDVQTFLLKTAVLDRLTGPLCDALTNKNNGRTTLEMLEHGNLFIVPLDEERCWYRYHRLFADLLRQQLRQRHPDWIPDLHGRASEWYAQQNQPADAIRHALAAADYGRAADLAELIWPDWSTSYRAITWLGWVKNLPDDLIRTRPVLCVALAQALLNAGQLEAAEARLVDAERWLEPADGSHRLDTSAAEMAVADETQFQALPAKLATARAYHAQTVGDFRGTVTYVNRALDLLPEADTYNRAAVTGLVGLAYWASGDLAAAYQTFSEGLFQNTRDLITGTFVLADMQMTLGRLGRAESICERGLELAKAHVPPLPIGTEDIYSGISLIHQAQGKLDTAVHDLQMCQKLGQQVNLPDWRYRWCIAQSQVDVSMGDLDSALDLLDEASRVYVRTPLPEIRPIAAMKARVWLKQGRLNQALAWTQERGLSVDDDLSYLREFEHITLARVLIAQYEQSRADDALNEAVQLLERLLKAAEEGKRTGSAIEILALQALAFAAQGSQSPALTALKRALTLAEPEGFFQRFVDEGAPMARLLYEILSQGIASYFVRRLLTAFPVSEPEQAVPAQPESSEFDWIEPLSERELEVLQLIAEGLTNQEIATRLFLALNTVKAHTRNIYGKLGVNSRIQAVARARDLGFLSPI
ncbi:MAG: helix-turn-helix transcriptional regulator [Ardenticatenaceae bacterium]|nr:helix-turn-helix transcriptional regulator [Ardenticatenaceae bacterium]MCB9445974.1 helix-turn-helix transcriptional regulator [Ardenticatenaceae bacterium]